jgi:hypothetical protein
LWTGTTDSSLFVLAGSDQLPRNIPIRIRRLAPALAEPTAGTTTAPPGTSTARVLPGSGNEPSSWGPPIGLIASDLTAVVTTINDRPVRLAYQPPTSSTFLSEQTSRQQPANSTFLSEQMDIAIQNSLGGKKKTHTHKFTVPSRPPHPKDERDRVENGHGLHGDTLQHVSRVTRRYTTTLPRDQANPVAVRLSRPPG